MNPIRIDKKKSIIKPSDSFPFANTRIKKLRGDSSINSKAIRLIIILSNKSFLFFFMLYN